MSRIVVALVLAFVVSAATAAQTPPPAPPPQEPAPTQPAPPQHPAPVQPAPAQPAPPPPVQAEEDDEDMRLDPAQPDFTLVNLPTTLRVPRFKSGFRVTHRFSPPLGSGDLGDVVEDLFGLDRSSLIGLEFRFGLAPGVQIGIHRTSAKTIQLFTQLSAVRQSDTRPVGVDALVAVSGTDNFRDEHATALGILLSRKVGRSASFYLEPIGLLNTHPTHDHPPGFVEDDADYSVMVGLGMRLRIRPTVYLVGEVVPQIAGYRLGAHPYAFALEKRVGGHAFQIVFANSIWTTFYDLAAFGGIDNDVYIGFNISRKFF